MNTQLIILMAVVALLAVAYASPIGEAALDR